MLEEKAMVNLLAKEMKNITLKLKKKKKTGLLKKHFHSSTLPKGYQLVTSLNTQNLNCLASSTWVLTSEIQPIQG